MKTLLTSFFLIIVQIFLLNPLNGQIEGCGAYPTIEAIQIMDSLQEDINAYSRNFLDGSQFRNISNIPIQVHIINQNNGTGGITENEINNAINTLNEFYANADLSFFICNTINYINDDAYYDFSETEETSFMNTYGVDNIINLIIPGGDLEASNGVNICGYAYLPWSSPQKDIVIIKKSCMTSGNTFAHEIGHYFGLYHTHGTTNNGTTDELVNQTNCGYAGDRVCDTPADPNLYNQVDINCQYTGNETDANGDYYVPDETNIMSYSRHTCRDFFSPNQYARISYYFDSYRNYLVCPEVCNAPLLDDFLALSINANSAQLNCFIEDVVYYGWAIRKEGEDDWFISDTYTDNYQTFTGLEANTVYEYLSTVNCDGNEWSDWSSLKTFRTTINAGDPILFMTAGITFSPNPVPQGTDVSFSFNVANLGTSNFTGSISLDLYDENFDYIQELSIYNESDLCTNCFYTDGLNLSTYIDVTPGNYYVIGWYQEEGGDWLQINDNGYYNISTLTVIGSNNNLTITPSNIQFDASGDSEVINVNSNINWTASESSSWLSITGANGSNNGEFTITASENTNTSSRTATVTVSGDGMQQTVSITQNGESNFLTISDNDLQFDASGNNEVINVSSNVNWTASESSSWLSIANANGSNNGEFTITASENTSTSNRTTTITVSGGGIQQTLSITQDGQNNFLTTSDNDLQFDASGDNEVINVNSNVNWTASESSSWLSIANANGSNNGEFTITASENTSTSNRTAAVTVSGGGMQQTVSITQDGQGISNIPWVISVTGDNHTVIIPTAAEITVEGNTIETGDAIGFFYAQNGTLQCSNYIIWDGNNTSLAVYGNDSEDGEKNGFDDGELFQVKIYRPSSMEEFSAQVTFVPANESPIATHTSTYANDGISMLVTLHASTELTMDIDLIEGWNMISTYLTPSEPDMIELLTAIENEVVLLKDGDGNTVIPSFDINNVGDWQLKDGYKIKVNQNTSLQINGTPINAANESISLETGWQIIAYLKNTPQDAAVVFDDISTNIEIVKNNSGATFIPFYNINNLGEMSPTQGYQVKANQSTNLVYSNFISLPTEKNRIASKKTVQTQYFIIDSTFNTGNNATLIFPSENMPEWLLPGDEIGIFNQAGFLAGAAVFDDENFAITVWGDDLATEIIDGLSIGENYSIKVWQAALATEHQLSMVMEMGDGLYQIDDIEVVGSLDIVSKLRKVAINQYLIYAYPNPTNKMVSFVSTDVQYKINQIEFFTAVGEKVFSQQFEEGRNKVNIDVSGFSAGLYFVSIETDYGMMMVRVIRE